MGGQVVGEFGEKTVYGGGKHGGLDLVERKLCLVEEDPHRQFFEKMLQTVETGNRTEVDTSHRETEGSHARRPWARYRQAHPLPRNFESKRGDCSGKERGKG